MQDYIIKRDGQPPLTFKGDEIGKGTTRDHNSTRWTNVTIYKTKGGKYVAYIERATQWQGECNHDEAVSRSEAIGIIQWLKQDGENLGRASQRAVENAAESDANFSAAWVERVE